MRLTVPSVKVRSSISWKTGKRRWNVFERTSPFPIGFPNHRQFSTWEAAYRAADHYARTPQPRT